MEGDGGLGMAEPKATLIKYVLIPPKTKQIERGYTIYVIAKIMNLCAPLNGPLNRCSR